MTSTNKPKMITLCLILFFTAFGTVLANATTEDNYKNDTNLLPRIYESTHTENGYKASIIINPHTTGIYTKENGYNLDLTINPQGIGGKYTENNYQLDLIPEKTFPHIPDIAVTNVTFSKTVVGQGFSCKINTTVSNQGLYYETFDVTLNANTTTIKTKAVTLTSKGYTTNTFIWNTTGVAKGNYTITAEATPVPGETDTTDNTLTDGWIIVAMVGDITGLDGWPDGTCNIRDVALVAKAFGANLVTDPTSPRYGEYWHDPPCNTCPHSPNCDLTGPTIGVPDGKINIRDIALVAIHFGEEDP